MSKQPSNPLLHPFALLLVAVSLSIGWGIRGNFGHEAGAMIAGALAAMAVAIVSGREDWRQRVLYFGLFGALGWGFGGSIAYMYPISFTESGHTASTYYGYFALVLEGGLWCGMGAAGTALAAVMPLARLTRFFPPLSKRRSNNCSPLAARIPVTILGSGTRAHCTGSMPIGCRRFLRCWVSVSTSYSIVGGDRPPVGLNTQRC
jgi:hypothetical protein